MAIANLGFRVDSSQVAKAVKNLSSMDAAAVKLGKSVGLAGAAIAAAFGGAEIIRGIADFDRAMGKVVAVTSATTSEMNALRSSARAMGSATEFSSKQAADGLLFLGQAGFEAAEAVEAIPQILDLATAASLGLAEAADITSNIMSAYAIPATEAARVTDILAAAASSSNTDVTQMGQAMKFVGPVAAALGVSVNDTAAAVGKLSDAGIQGGQAGTTLRKILLSLSAPTKEAETAIRGLGLSLTEVDPNVVSITDIVGKFADAGVDAASGAKIFGQEAVSGILALTSVSGQLDTLTQKMQNVTGTSSEMANVIRDDLRGDIDALFSSLSSLVLSLGEAGLTAAIRAVVQTITVFSGAAIVAVDAIGGMLGAITVFDGVANSVDTLNLAMADNIAQIDALNIASGDTVQVSQMVALNKLREAEAHLEAAAAKREEAKATILNSDAYQEVITRITDARNALTSMRAAGDDLDDMPLRMRDAYEETEQSIIDAYNSQKELLSLIPDTSAEYDRAAGLVEELRKRIEESEGEMVTLGGKTKEAADTTAALARLANGVHFNGAITSAEELAKKLGIAVALANQLNAIGGSGGASGPDGAINQVRTAYTDANTSLSIDQLIERGLATTKVYKAATDSVKKYGGAAGGASDAQEELNDKMEEGETLSESLRTSQEKYVDDLAKLKGLLDVSAISLETYNRAVRDLNVELANSDPATKNLIGGLEDVVDYALGGFQDGMDGIVDIVQDTLKQIAKDFVTQNFIIPIQAQIGASVASNAGIAGSGADAGGGILSQLTSGAGIFGKTGVFGQLGANLGTTIGTALGGAGSALAASLGSIGSAIGAAVPIIGIAVAAISFFKTKTVELDAGIRVTGQGVEALVESFKILEKTKFWGLSKKTVEEYEAASSDISDPITDAIYNIGQTVGGLADIINLESGRISDVVIDFSVTTKDKTEAEIQDALTAEFTRIGDDFTEALFGTYTELLPDEAEIARLDKLIADTTRSNENGRAAGSLTTTIARLEEQRVAAETAVVVTHVNEAFAELQQEGEGSLDTLTRLVSNLSSVNDALFVFEQVSLDMSLSGATAAAALVELSGGAETFAANVTHVFDNMFTDAEKDARLSEIAIDKLNSVLGDLGVSVPETHAEFVALKNAQDLNTESGRELYAALIGLSGAFVQVNGTAQQASDAIVNDLQAALDVRSTDVDDSLAIMNNRVTLANQNLSDAESDLAAAFANERSIMVEAYNAQITAANASKTAAVATARDAESAANDRVTLRNSIVDALNDSLNDRYQETLSDQIMAFESATSYLSTALIDGVSDEDTLKDALSVVADPVDSMFKSGAEQLASYRQQTDVIERLKGVNEEQLTSEEILAIRLADQTDIISTSFDDQIEAITDAHETSLEGFDNQLNALLGIDGSVMSVADAIRALDLAKAASDAVGSTTASRDDVGALDVSEFVAGSFGDMLNQMYNTAFGRDVRAAGLAFYGEAYANGLSYAGIMSDLLGSDERSQYLATGIPSFDGGGSTGNGARSGGIDGKGGFLSILHPQEEVIDKYGMSNTPTRTMSTVTQSSTGNEMSARFEALQIDVIKMRKVLVKWDRSGMPQEREAISLGPV